MAAGSYVSALELIPSSAKVRMDEPLTLDVKFRIDGQIRELFNQQTWTDAYDKHDTVFGVKYTIRVQRSSMRNRDIVEPLAFVRKASFYWSRNPKTEPKPPSKKIWAMIVMDDAPTLPDSIEHARSLIFDVRRPIELMGSSIGEGRQKLVARVTAS
ncbi:MAG: hypothetical protein ACE5JV_00545, partial [Nitrososphaerales archaeon]